MFRCHRVKKPIIFVHNSYLHRHNALSILCTLSEKLEKPDDSFCALIRTKISILNMRIKSFFSAMFILANDASVFF